MELLENLGVYYPFRGLKLQEFVPEAAANDNLFPNQLSYI